MPKNPPVPFSPPSQQKSPKIGIASLELPGVQINEKQSGIVVHRPEIYSSIVIIFSWGLLARAFLHRTVHETASQLLSLQRW